MGNHLRTIKLRLNQIVILLPFFSAILLAAPFFPAYAEDEKSIIDSFRKQSQALLNSAQSQAPAGLSDASKANLATYLKSQSANAANLCAEIMGLKMKADDLKMKCSELQAIFASSIAGKLANLQAGVGADQVIEGMTKVMPNDANSMSVPDPQNEWIGAVYVPFVNPSPAYQNAKDANEKARAYHAEMLERTVRVFVSGSNQLQRDKGVNYGAAGMKEVKGMYQGFMPDLVSSTKEVSVSGPYMPDWGDCALGIANEENDTQKWFKSPSGAYEKERIEGKKLYSHQCQGKPNSTLGKSGDDPRIRGKIVNALMLFMKKMQTDMLTQGKFVTASGYGLKEPTTCLQIAAEINVMRKRLREIREEITQGMTIDQKASALACVATQDGSAVKLNGKTLEGATARGCLYDSMQSLTENQNVGLYAYCTWSTVAAEIIARMSRAMAQQPNFEASTLIEALATLIEKNPGAMP